MKKCVILFALLLIWGCTSSRLVAPEQKDTLDFLLGLTEEIQSDSTLQQTGAAAMYSAVFDSLCDTDFTLAHKYDIETLLNRTNKTFSLDTVLTALADREQNNLLSVSLNEVRFRMLVTVQDRLNSLYENEDAYRELETLENKEKGKEQAEEKKKTLDKFERHGKWVFKEKVSWMLVLIQENDKYSRIKTNCLYGVMNILQQLEDASDKKRSWLAIDRMLDVVDIQKSESGYTPFQRSAFGIYADKGVVIKTLLARRAGEINDDVIALADKVIQKVEKQLSAKKDKEFWAKVYESRALQNVSRKQARGIIIDSNGKIYDSDSLNALYWFEKGYSAENTDQQIQFYSKAIDLDPEMTEAYNNRGNIYQGLGNENEALKEYDKAISLDPYYAPVYINRGNTYQNLGDYDKAIKDYHSAVMLAPDNAQAFLYRGMCYKNMGQYLAAIQDFAKVQKMNTTKKNLVMALYYSGSCFYKMKKFDQALRDFDRVLELDPDYVSVYIQRGDIYRYLKDFNHAILSYDKAMEIDSLNAIAYNNRGMCYKKLGNKDLAIRDYEKAVEIQPDYASAWYNLGRVYWEQRKWKKVVAAWEECLEVDPEYQLAKKWLPKAKERTKKRYITIEVEVQE